MCPDETTDGWTDLEEEALENPEEFAEEIKTKANDYVESILHDPREVREWLRQRDLTYGGLIGIGVIMVQPFLNARSLDLSAKICVGAFAVAIPLLAALILLNRQEMFRSRTDTSRLVVVGLAMAQASAVTGVVAGFWHIHWVAGVLMLVSGVLGLAVHSAGWSNLELGQVFGLHKESRGPGDSAP